jgi:Do/DeqQ family serine protease
MRPTAAQVSRLYQEILNWNLAMRILVSALLAVCLVTPVVAQQRVTPETRPQVQFSFAPTVRQVAPSVVNVFGLARVQRNPMQEFFGADPFFRRFFGGERGQERNIPSTPERVQNSLGSGVIVSADGLVVTNHHVIAQSDEVRVALSDRREFEADVILRDERSDLAVLRLRQRGNERFPAIEIGDSDRLEVGDFVLALGNPFGVGQTVTSGIVSALARTQVGITDFQFFIQTDAAINPGNSGGALVDMAGRLVGINTAIYSRTGGSVGIGFAIPVSMVRIVIASAAGGSATVRRPWLGARLQPVTNDIAESLGLRRPQGALVQAVTPNTPAQRAGLRQGDVILALDGQEIDDVEAFGFRFATKPVGGESRFTIMRRGGQQILPVRLESPSETRPRDAGRLAGRSPFAGANVANLSPSLADELRLDVETEGVAVLDVEQGSPAEQLGLRRGDILRVINGERIDNARQVRQLTADRQRLWRFSIEREGQLLSTVVGG